MWINRNMVMLPTNKKAIIGDLALSHNNVLNFAKNEDWLVIYNPIKQHLYITSDEEIKENSLVLLPNNTIHRMNASDMISYLDSQSKATKLIIATTQPFMNLPQPSQQFIEKYIEEYNKGNVITKVDVEYDADYNERYKAYYADTIELKVNPDNTINIKPIKDSWNREEVIKLFHKYKIDHDGDGSYYKDILNKWIAENL